MNNVDQTMRNEAKIVRHMTEKLAEAGWVLFETDDGGESIKTTTADEAIDVMHSVDESFIRYAKDGKVKTVYAITGNGNDGWDLIADYSTGDGFDDVLDAVNEKIMEWECA